MDHTKAVETKAGEELEVDEILVLVPVIILLLVVTADTENLTVILGYRNNIRKLDAR